MKKQKILLFVFSAITIIGGAAALPAQYEKMGCPAVPDGCTVVEPCTCKPNPTGGTICSDKIQCG